MFDKRKKNYKESQAKSIALWCKLKGKNEVATLPDSLVAQSAKEIINENLSEIVTHASQNFLDEKVKNLDGLELRQCLQSVFAVSANDFLGKNATAKLEDKAKERAQNNSHYSLNNAIKGISLHINYWHFSVDSKKPDILDIGLMIPKIKGVEELCLYLPINLEKSDVEDITSLLRDNEISTAIFNENLSSQQKLTRDHYKLLKGDKYFCTLRSFLKDHVSEEEEFGFRKASGNDGVIVSIKGSAIEKALSDNIDEGKAYFRLRLNLDTKEKKEIFIRKDLPKDKYFVSGFEVTEYIDFRINETRLLPQGVQEEIEHWQGRDLIPVKRIDFLLATTPGADIKISGESFHKSRYLEANPWKKYLASVDDNLKNTIESGMVVYHWKSSATIEKPIEDFLAFVKLRVRLSQTKKIAFYLLLIIFFGGVGSLWASEIEDRWDLLLYCSIFLLCGSVIRKLD